MEKIIVFTPSLNIGGIERILLTYAKGLADKGYKVTYLTLSDQGDFKLKATENLAFENLGIKRLRQALIALVKFLKKNKPDVILCANDATLMVYIAKVLSGIKTKIITSHHNYYENYLDLNFKNTFVPKFVYPCCFKVIAVSEGIRKMLLNDFHIKPNKVVTISNPIDIEQIQYQANEMVNSLPHEYILFVGRFDKVKNIPFLIDAFNLFNKKFPDVKLLLIGGGPESDMIIDYIKHSGLQNSVELLGVKSNPFPYIKNAKIVVLSSISEAFPTVLLESLVLGKTIVSTPTYGGMDILKNGKYGYISKSISDITNFYENLVQGYLKSFDPSVLEDYASSNYQLNLKVIELQKAMEI